MPPEKVLFPTHYCPVRSRIATTVYGKPRFLLGRFARKGPEKSAFFLADLSINYVERQILMRGFAENRMVTDYGIDLLMLTYSNEGEVESGQVLFQVKATDSLRTLGHDVTIACRIEVADLKAWQDEWLPVILVVYDGHGDRAYWLYVQQYVNEKNVSGEDLLAEQDRVTVRIPRKNRLDRKAVERFRQIRNQHVDLMKGGHHGH